MSMFIATGSNTSLKATTLTSNTGSQRLPLYPPSDDENNLSDDEDAMKNYEAILTKAADRYTPSIAQAQSNSLQIKTSADEHDALHERQLQQKVNNLIPMIPQDLNPQAVAKLDSLGKEMGADDTDKKGEGHVAQTLKDKEIIGLQQKAATQTVQLGVRGSIAGTILGGAAVLAALSPTITLPVALVPAAILTTVTTAIGDLLADLLTNKYAFPGAKQKAAGIFPSLKKLFEPAGSKSVTFAGKGRLKTRQIHTLKAQMYSLVVESEKRVKSAETSEQLAETLQIFLKKFLTLNLQAVEHFGSDHEKKKARILKDFSENYDQYVNSIPPFAMTMREVPLVTQNMFRRLIYVALSSGVEELVNWGGVQAKHIGMNENQINKVIRLSSIG